MDFYQFSRKIFDAFKSNENQTYIFDVLLVWYIYQLDPLDLNGKTTYKAIEIEFGITNSSVSRNVNRLGSITRQGKTGFGLLEIENDPEEGRRYLVKLSKVAKCIFMPT